MFKFEEIFGVKLHSELQNNADSIALDLSLTSKALYSARSYDIFEPFPTFFLRNKENRDRSVFSNGKITEFQKENKNIAKMLAVFEMFPAVTELKSCEGAEVKRIVERV